MVFTYDINDCSVITLKQTVDRYHYIRNRCQLPVH